MMDQLELDVKTFMEDFEKEGLGGMESIISSKNIQKVMDFLNGMADSLRVKAEVMGARMAAGMRTFMLSGAASATIGEKLGWLYGNIIVEVVLAVFTIGIGTAIKGGLTAMKWVMEFFQWFSKFGKFGRALLRVAEFFAKGFKWLIEAVQKFAKKLMEIGQAAVAKFEKIFENLQKKIDDIVAKLRGKADDVSGQTDEMLEHADDVPGVKPKLDGDDVVDTKHIDPEDAKTHKPKGNEADDLLWAAAEAKAMLAIYDAADLLPAVAAMLAFKRLHQKYKWIKNVEADAVGGGWDIFIIASKHKVYDDYEVTDDARTNRRKDYNAHHQLFDQEIEDRLARGEISADEAADLSHYNQHTPVGGLSVDDALARFQGYNDWQKRFEKQLREMDGISGQMRDDLRRYNEGPGTGKFGPDKARTKFEAGYEYDSSNCWFRTKTGSSGHSLTSHLDQLKEKIKHAPDFGESATFSWENAEKFEDAMLNHMNSSSTTVIPSGVYRGDPAIFYVDPTSALNVVTSPTGEFITSYRLFPNQLSDVLTRGFLW